MQKFLLASASACVSMASLASIRSQLQEIMHSRSKRDAKALGETFTGASFLDYGCWCFFEEENSQKAKGAPVDVFDEQCKLWHMNANCAVIDDASCDPYTQEYTPVVNQFSSFTDAEIRSECANANVGSCRVRTCEIESKFIMNVNSLIFNPNHSITAAFFPSNGFDHDSQCPGFPGVQADKQCCGLSPSRYPYDAAVRSCCAASGFSFNSATHQCCADGSIVTVGGC